MVDYYLGLGILMLLALFGVYLVNKYGQSVILAYIVVGVLIGPNLPISVAGFDYHGIITNKHMIHELLELGLVFLFFFVGLEFSITRLRETKKAAAVIAITHVSMNLFVGFAIGTIFGWNLFSSIFLAGVIAVSSAAVATKTLKDLGRLSGREVKFLLTSIIVEDFILIIMVALTSGSAMHGGDLDTWAIMRLILSVCFLYAIFLLLGFIIVPRLYHYLEKIQSDELFVLFAMAVIFLAASLAEFLQIPRPLGAFFMGMTFAETKFSDRLIKKLDSIRKGFTAIFFMSFGMMVSFNSDVISMVIPMLIITIPLIIFNQVLILGSISYILGFMPREAVTIGSCLAGRGEDTLLYASVGANLQKVGSEEFVFSRTTRDTLFSFAGIYCFIMATLAPIIVKNIPSIVRRIRSGIPEKWAFGAYIIQRTIRQPIFSVGGPFTRKEKRLLILFSAYAAFLFGVILIRTPSIFLAFVIGGGGVIYLLRGAIDQYISPYIDVDNYPKVHLLIKDTKSIRSFVINTLVKLISAPFMGATLWAIAQILRDPLGFYAWQIAHIGALFLVILISLGMNQIYTRTMVRPRSLQKEHILKGFHKGDKGDRKGKPEKYSRPRKKDRAKKTFEPVKYEQLLPLTREEDSKGKKRIRKGKKRDLKKK